MKYKSMNNKKDKGLNKLELILTFRVNCNGRLDVNLRIIFFAIMQSVVSRNYAIY